MNYTSTFPKLNFDYALVNLRTKYLSLCCILVLKIVIFTDLSMIENALRGK